MGAPSSLIPYFISVYNYVALCNSCYFKKLMMTPNCTNTMSKRGQRFEKILPQGKDLQNSWELGKVAATHKIIKLVFPETYLSLKTRGSGKVLYSKSSCSRYIFFNQPTVCSVIHLVSLWAMIISKERTFTPSPCVHVREIT